MASMLQRWRILCKEQDALKLDALVLRMEVRAKEPLKLAWRDSAIQAPSCVNQEQLDASSSSAQYPILVVRAQGAVYEVLVCIKLSGCTSNT
jgi:hypothetical protein